MAWCTPGIQASLRRGDVTAQIAQVGASLRGLHLGDVDLICPYPLDEPTPGCSGVVLAPWPTLAWGITLG